MKSNAKSRINSVKHMKGLLLAGLVLMVLGGIVGYLLPEEEHLATRIAGFVSGLGSALMMMGGVLLLRRWRLGEERVQEAELAMNDERGLAVAYRAQSIAAIAAVYAIIAIMMAALIRGDSFYAKMGSMLLCIVALIKLAAWHIYNKRM